MNERDRFIQREVERETIIYRDKRDYRERYIGKHTKRRKSKREREKERPLESDS